MPKCHLCYAIELPPWNVLTLSPLASKYPTLSHVATNTSAGEKALEKPAASTQSEARLAAASSDAARYQTSPDSLQSTSE